MAIFKKPADIKLGVIGYGGAFNMGKAHFNEASRAGMTPTAVADLDPERLRIAEEEFPGIQTYTDVKKMLASSDANLIIIITPHNTHAALSVQCLEAGKHVVVEKPFAVTTEECDAMIQAAKDHQVMLSTYHNRHWDGCILHALETIQSGIIGDIVRIEARMGSWGKPGDWWRSSKSISGGILYDWGVHLLEYSLQLLDTKMVEVMGYSKTGFWGNQTTWKDDTNEDEATAMVRFENGAYLFLQISHLESNPHPKWLEITGTKGTYAFDHMAWECITHENGTTVTKKGKNPDSQSWQYYQNVADHLVKDTPLVIYPEWARRPVHILDLAGKSAAAGKTFPVSYT
jgi:scyllo-inositol 2-dehydrogenase (NADP+)